MENCYIDVIGYKSYAHLYYGQRKQTDNTNSHFLKWLKNNHPDAISDPALYRKYFSEWLLNGDIDKPAYFATNASKAELFKNSSQLHLIDEKNGYVFFQRMPDY